MNDPMKPSMKLLCKLGSVITHAEELLSPDGHAFDKIAFENTLKDPEVSEWLKEMREIGLIPVKRTIDKKGRNK